MQQLSSSLQFQKMARPIEKSLPFGRYFTSIPSDLSSKQCHRGISRWRPCFHYTAQCPVLDHTAFRSSLFPSFLSLYVQFPRSWRAGPASCSTFCKSSDISTGMCPTFNLAPVSENSNFIIAGLSGQRQWRSVMASTDDDTDIHFLPQNVIREW